MQEKSNLKVYKIINADQLKKAENRYRKNRDEDFMPVANGGTPYLELAELIYPDQNGPWVTPLFIIICAIDPIREIDESCKNAMKYLTMRKETELIDVLSISAYMENGKIRLVILVRAYNGKINFSGFFDFIGESLYKEEENNTPVSGNLVIPDSIKSFSYTMEEIEQHEEKRKKQDRYFEKCTKERPFLNSIKEYEPLNLPSPEDTEDLIYDLVTNDMKEKTVCDYDTFTTYFREILTYVNGIEYYSYINVMVGEVSEDSFMNNIELYVSENYVMTGKLDKEDLPKMMKKLHRALFQLYIIQDLIDDPLVTDIKITAPDSIRARVKGKAYLSNINFVDKNDYLRFINGIVVKNRVSLKVPEQTFTDDSDKNFIIRYSITSDYVNAPDWPYLHIRKIDRNKPMDKELIEAGMYDEKVMNYLKDCAKHSRGVVFCGPPGSGKTVLLNWFLEQYEQSCEILVIQENDELFTNRKGVMFQHVVNYSKNGEIPVNLEQLGSLALVAGANVFIIGEAKGAEICSAVTLSNSGCRSALTLHANSSTDAIDKMADLMMRGYAENIEQAKRSLKSFDTIVFIKNFEVNEISQIIGYNEQRKDMEYRYIYKKYLY